MPIFWGADRIAFAKGAQSSKFDHEALLKTDFDPGINVIQQAEGWYLELGADQARATEQKRQAAVTEMLGKAFIRNFALGKPDGSALAIEAGCFRKRKDILNPFPGPFEFNEGGKTAGKSLGIPFPFLRPTLQRILRAG